MDYVLECKKISKSFSGIEVLHDVNLEIERNTVHAVVGENGAGKSTLMNIIAGVLKPTSGHIYKNGMEVKLNSPQEAFDHNVGIVHQELSLAENLTVAENIMIGREPINKLGFINKQQLNNKAKEYLDSIGIDLNPESLSGSLSVGLQQIVEIIKVISQNIDLLILDEPTSSLSEKEIQNFFNFLMKIKKERNLSVIFISHKLNEVMQIADRTTVLRDGCLVGTLKKSEMTTPKIINLMIGRDLDYNRKMLSTKKPGKAILKTRKLTGDGFRDISFDLHENEILGLFGLVGAGRTEMACSLIGYRELYSGNIFLDDKKINLKTPKEAVKKGICYVTEDRKNLGLFLTKSMKYNVIASSFSEYKKGFGIMDEIKAEDTANNFVKRLNINPQNIYQKVSEFSGGNQQKIVISKSLAVGPKALIIDEPTRGVDVGAKETIHTILRGLAESGIAILMISSELPEILKLSDRVMVMYEGIYKGTLNNVNLSEEDIMSLAYTEDLNNE